ncbi:MAG: FAD-dependent oxidoreductase [Candidatus Humimicrobiaceae bacterium]
MNNDKHDLYEIIIVGSGIAGCEAGFICAESGLKTLIVNISMDNPALLKYSARFGGISNSALLDKIDLLGGFIKSAVLENKIAQKKEKKGNNIGVFTVADKRKFTLFYKYSLENQANLHTRQGLVTEMTLINRDKDRKYMIGLSDGSIFYSKAVIISVGTFLNSYVFWGKNKMPSGRNGEINSRIFYETLKNMGYSFKSKTVFVSPRIDRRTIDLKKVRKIISDADINSEPLKTHESSRGYIKDIHPEKYYCFKSKISKARLLENITKISKNNKSEKSLKMIRSQISKAEMQSIESDEYEIEMFSEGEKTMELYADNFNLVFSDEEQNLVLNKFYGLENAAIIRPGYCIEYKGLKQCFLNKDLESNIHKNIYFAGEVNGPQQYESIALQGVTAGINASRSILAGS